MPTLQPAGRWALGTGLVLGPASWWAGYPQLLTLAGVALLMVLGSVLGTRRPAHRVALAKDAARLTEGDTAAIAVDVVNPLDRRSRPAGLRQELGALTWEDAVPALRRHATHQATMTVDDAPRGVYEATTATLWRADALGLVRNDRTVPLAVRLVVRARTADLVPLARSWSTATDGRTSEMSLRGGDAFHGMREYVPGDDSRLIHWPTTARLGTLMIRETVVPDVERHVVVLDTAAGGYADEGFDDAVRACASIVTADAPHLPITLCLTGTGTVRSQAVRDAADGLLLDELAQVRTTQGHPGAERLPLGDVASSAVTVVTGADADRPRQWWLRARDAALFTVVQVMPAPSGSYQQRQGGARIVAPNLAEFARAWNAWCSR